MIFYHFGFDLNYLGWLHQNLNTDLGWLAARAAILSTFLFSVGASFALAQEHGTPTRHHFFRILKISSAALLVTAGSWLAFPKSAIYFGTLHAIAVMSGFLLITPRRAWLVLILGVLAVLIGNSYASSYFDRPELAWLGLMTHKPVTEDYVPILPWFGTCLIGYGLTRKLLKHKLFAAIERFHPNAGLLSWMGRHSLAIYLLHQPIMLGLLITLTHYLN